MWCFDSRREGFSLTEVLVVLAILSLTVAIFATARPGPSSAMRQEALVSDLIAEAALIRGDAIVQGDQKTLEMQVALCPNSAQELVFFADGTAIEAQVCLAAESGNRWLYLDPLTGMLNRQNAQ